MDKKHLDSKPFDLSARVTMQLGRESISSSTVAISELIKNSYDADANKVTIDFFLNDEGKNTLVITDDGLGMNLVTLTEHWLKIGTSNKVSASRSPIKKRIRAGAKGLGRLGVDRLCKKLQLFTKTSGIDYAILLEVDWRKYEGVDSSLSEIKHDIFEVKLPLEDEFGKSELSKDAAGTRLVLCELTDRWTDKFIDALVNELRLLVSPFQSWNDFKIELNIIKNGKRIPKDISSEHILDAARWHVKGVVDNKGLVSIDYENNLTKETVKLDATPWSDWIKGVGSDVLFGPVSFEFYFMPQGKEDLKRVNLQAKNFREFMRLNQGVRLYRDHFRVRPYGEPTGKGDWLDLGYRKASSPGGIGQGGWRIGPNQIVGSIIISRVENSILNDQANREGIVENEAFEQLRTFLIKTIESFEILAHKDAKKHSQNDTNLVEELSNWIKKESKKHNEEYNDSLYKIKKIQSSKKRKQNRNKKATMAPEKLLEIELKKLETLVVRQEKIQSKVNELIFTYGEQLEKIEYQKDTLANLASIGILSISFGHEVRQHSSIARSGISNVIRRLNQVTEPDRYTEKALEQAKCAFEGAKYVDNFSRFALENIKPDKRKQCKVNVYSVIEYVFTMFHETLKKMDVEYTIIDNLTNQDLKRVYSFEIDWESIMINLLTNATWALEEQKGVRKIEVELRNNDDDGLLIFFSDSGIGLEAGDEENIFLPMKSGKRDNAGNSIGTGMGLAIVKTHVEDHMKGSISASNHSVLGGATFMISIPKKGK